MTSIVVTGPYLENGGVAQFIRNLYPYFGKDTKFFKRGKRSVGSRFSFLFPLIDVLRFFIFMIVSRPQKVIINSSLAKVGMIRDGCFIRISKIVGARAVLYIHGFEQKELQHSFLLAHGYFKADKLFVLSSEFKSLLVSAGCKKPIHVSNNPIGDDLINVTIKSLKGDRPKKLKILMMSRIVESKGIFVGLKTLTHLKNSNFELHIAGTGPDLERSVNFAKERKLDNVVFHGFISGKDKLQLLLDSDILLFPTTHNEGLPINILEALAAGVYVISRPLAGIVDLSEHYDMKLLNSVDSKEYAHILQSLFDSGLPAESIKENQLKAKNDFAPQTIYKNVVLNS